MGGLCRRLSRFVLNDVVSAWMTFASSVDAISSTNEFFACDNSALREARVRERNSVPYRCVTSFGRVALIRHSQVRTTRCSRVGESLTPSVICSLRWAKLQINPSRLSSTNAMNLWNKYYGRSLGCNKLSISTPGCLSLSLRSCPGNQYLSRTRQPTAAFRWFSSGNLDDEGLACTPFAELDDIAVRQARRPVIRSTLHQYGSSKTKQLIQRSDALLFSELPRFLPAFGRRVSRSSTSRRCSS